jgi:cytochrome c
VKAAATAALAAVAIAAFVRAEPTGRSPGEAAFDKCYSCHELSGGEALEGPPLKGVIGRKVAAEPGFDYSPALRRLAAEHPVWTQELLDRFVADPEGVAPGTAMAFAGIKDSSERAALIAYLRQAAEPDGN